MSRNQPVGSWERSSSSQICAAGLRHCPRNLIHSVIADSWHSLASSAVPVVDLMTTPTVCTPFYLKLFEVFGERRFA
jgi:hypothetical protein